MKKKEIVHTLKVGCGMVTGCSDNISTSFDKDGVPSYSLKYSFNRDEINCESCLSYIKSGTLPNNVKEKLICINLKEKSIKNKPEKPVKPIEPKADDLKYVGDARSTKNWDSPFVVDYKKYQKDIKKYEEQLEIYEQTKLIRFIKNADEKLILKKFKINKK